MKLKNYKKNDRKAFVSIQDITEYLKTRKSILADRWAEKHNYKQKKGN